MTDWKQYGLPEFWDAAKPGGFEDCDGYSLAKRGRLLESGWPYQKLMLCTCVINSTGEGHMVVAVDTDKGWFIMDNNFPDMKDPKDMPYMWIGCLREGEWQNLKWDSV